MRNKSFFEKLKGKEVPEALRNITWKGTGMVKTE
jgi:hypothetical protein